MSVPSSAVFAKRRTRLLEAAGEGLVIVRGAGPNRNFEYLTGLAEPAGALLLDEHGVRVGFGRAYPGRDYQRGRRVRQILFLPPSDPLLASWGEDGSATFGSVTAEQAGVDLVLPASEWTAVLGQALAETRRVHVVRAAEPTMAGAADGDAAMVADLRQRFFHLEVRDATAAVHAMRQRKEPGEIEAMRRAIAVTAAALEAAYATVRPGVAEHAVEAEITRAYRAAGARHAFDPIVGCGANACLLHYSKNTGTIRAGELLLIDTGAALGGYCADVTRTVPVAGKFTKRQREVYDVVLRALEAATARVAPGVSLGEVHEAAWQVISDAGFAESYPHGTSHHLGMDVHDVGDRFAPLAEGAVITVEPGIYLASEGIGVRIEDDVLVTRSGREVLTAAIAKDPEAIEAALGARA